jgi:hypothetical protein
MFSDVLITPEAENVSRETFSANKSIISQKTSFSSNMPNLAQSVSRETLCARF